MSAIKQPTLNYAFVAKVLAGLLARGRSLHDFKLGFISLLGQGLKELQRTVTETFRSTGMGKLSSGK